MMSLLHHCHGEKRCMIMNIYKELWQTWCMRRTENPENVVRLHEAPLLFFGWQYGVCSLVGKAPGCGSGDRGFESHQTPKCFNSTEVVQLSCKEQVVGSNPT